jgi:hypothetical protein
MRRLRDATGRAPAPLRAGALGALALLLVVGLVAGCGDDSTGGVARADADGSGTAATTTSTTEASVDAEQAQLDFARCMRDQGLDFPDPEPDAEGNLQFRPPDGDLDQGALQDGLEACEQHLENAGGPLADPDDPEFQDSQLDFARCMRDEGIDVPDPQAGQAPGAGAAGIDTDDPAVQAALDECGSLIAGAFGGQEDTP